MSAVHQLEWPVETSADGTLVQLHLGGHGDAFAALYREYFARLVRLCRARTGDLATAEDLAQEALLRALNHMDRFKIDRPMWPWLKTIAIRLTIDWSRQRRPEPCEDPCEGRSVSDDTGWLEEGPILAEALAGLPARQRVALQLRYLDDWSPAEAAAALGLTRPAFDQLLFRARGKLRVEYRRVCGDTPARLHAVIWPLLAVLHRVRHGLWRVKVVAQTATVPVHVAADAVAGLVVAATVGAAALGASLGHLDSAPPLTELHQIAVQDTPALAAASGFASIVGDSPSTSEEQGAPSSHDSFRTEPAPAVPVDYPDLMVRLAALPKAADPVTPSAPETPVATTPDAPAAPATQGGPSSPSASVATPRVDVTVPPVMPPNLPLPDLHEGLGL